VTGFYLNGERTITEGHGKSSLVHVLRNPCDTKDVRFGCGAGNCGACTVIVDGVAQQSCGLSTESIEGCDVFTPAALQGDPIGAVVLQAFLDEQAAQCGYCINGILMSLTALLKRELNPSKEKIIETLNRHLCRCGAHARILRATERAMHRLQAKG
jgi:aerobic-type carbon monoxide dehydrogenase small subunit (CoxS/CutS family)